MTPPKNAFSFRFAAGYCDGISVPATPIVEIIYLH
jgi:hypothetical protein